jgi:hypothetical protein
MKTGLKVGVICSLIFIAIKLICLLLDWSLFEIKPFVFLNMFMTTSAIAIALFQVKRYEIESNFLLDVKNAMTAGIIYTVIVSFFLFFYNDSIFPDSTERKLKIMEAQLEDPKNISELKASNHELKNRSDDEVRSLQMENAKRIYSPKFTLVVTLLGLTVFSIINSLLIAIIYRRFLFRS